MNFADLVIDKVLYKQIDSSGTGARVNKTSTPKHIQITLAKPLVDNEVMFFVPKVSGKMKVSVAITTVSTSNSLQTKVSVTKKIYKNDTLLGSETETDYIKSKTTYTYSFKQPISVEAFSRYRIEFEVSVIQDSDYVSDREFDYTAEVEGFLLDKPDLYIV